MKIQPVLISLSAYLLIFNDITYSQIQNTWELIKRHETYFKVQNQTDTTLTDTTIIVQSEIAFYRFSKDSLYIYEFDKEDSTEKNCYTLRISPYNLLNDSSLDVGAAQVPEVQTSATFKIDNDTLIYTEKWCEDKPDYVYHQTKVLYFFTIDCFTLPPHWWPQTECPSTNAVINNRLPGSTILHRKNISEYNLLGQSTIMKSSGIRVGKDIKRIEINERAVGNSKTNKVEK